MKNSYSFFKYTPKDSRVHLMNSKMKILWFLLSFLFLLLMFDYLSFAIFSLFLLLLIKKTKINTRVYAHNILVFWPLYVLLFILILLIKHDVSLSILIVLKFILIITLFLILTFTTSISEIAWGFECLLSPLKKINVPVSKISLKIALWIKFVSNLFDQSKAIRKSMAYRGVPYKGNKIKLFKSMTIPTIRLSYKLSLRTIAVMKLRFYGYSNKRTNYHENKVTNFDKTLIFIDVILLYIAIWLRWIL